jgi:hypothetical protein
LKYKIDIGPTKSASGNAQPEWGTDLVMSMLEDIESIADRLYQLLILIYNISPEKSRNTLSYDK